MPVLVPSRLPAPAHPARPWEEAGARARAGVGAQEPLGNPLSSRERGQRAQRSPRRSSPLACRPGHDKPAGEEPGEVYKGAEMRALGAPESRRPLPAPSHPQAPPRGTVPEAVPSSALPGPPLLSRGASAPRVIGRGVAGKGVRAGVWAGGGGEWRGLLTARSVPPCGCDQTRGCAAVQ